jgi:hypothetical protein
LSPTPPHTETVIGTYVAGSPPHLTFTPPAVAKSLRVHVALHAHRGLSALAATVGSLSPPVGGGATLPGTREFEYYSLAVTSIVPSATTRGGGIGAITVSGANWEQGMAADVGAPQIWRE